MFRPACIAALACALSIRLPSLDTAPAQSCPVRQVPRHEILEAMRLHSGDYNLAATTNLGRFQADVLLQIARWAPAAGGSEGEWDIFGRHIWGIFSRRQHHTNAEAGFRTICWENLNIDATLA